MNGSVEEFEYVGCVPGFNGGYFPSFIFDDLRRIVSSFIESFSNCSGL